ncbi:MAG: cytidine deaminase [Oscillospiraceae bacterium]|nr:cytidine deaminase [Oscillospiraceae bacterium]
MEREELIAMAMDAMARAYAPYSGFHVGAALLCADGSVYTGCNIENASYGATNCAERTAFFTAVAQGHRDFTAIAICGGPGGKIRDFCPPCGICRQVMAEFCDGTFQIHLAGPNGTCETYTLSQLLPGKFTL